MRKNTENRSRFGGLGTVFFPQVQRMLDPLYPPMPHWFEAGPGRAVLSLTGWAQGAQTTIVVRAQRVPSHAKAKRHMRALARAEFKAYQERYAKSGRSFD